MVNFILKFLRNTCGTAAIEAALILPLAGAVSFGMLESAMLMGELHRTNEAARAATREAILGNFLFTFSDGAGDYSVDCTGSGTALAPAFSCDETYGTSLHGDTDADNEFTLIFDEANRTVNGLLPANMVIRYEYNELSLTGISNVVTPSVTVTISGLKYKLLLLGVFPGIPSEIDIPAAKATRVAATALQ